MVNKVEKIEFHVEGQVVWSVQNALTLGTGTLNISSSPTVQNRVVAQGVRHVVGEYGEVLRKLSNE